MRPVKTTNQYFNRALDHLLEYHEFIDVLGTPMLNLSNRPKGIRTDRDWQIYLDCLLTVHVIGKRNGWTRGHVNRAGRAVYVLVDVPKDGKINIKKPGG